MRAALQATGRRQPKILVLAVPVAPIDSLSAMREETEKVVCLEDHEVFGVIGLYYSNFRQVSDEEVVEILRRLLAGRPSDGPMMRASGSPSCSHPARDRFISRYS
jgi:predicted phosphoribosyltransferase